jgi:hypothetical protein
MIGKKYALKATYPDGSIKYLCGRHGDRYSRRLEVPSKALNKIYLWEREGHAKNMLGELSERYKKPIQLEVIEVKLVFDE